MKHIEKRFILQSKKDENFKILDGLNPIDIKDTEKLKKANKKEDHLAFVQTDLNYTLGGITYNLSGTNCFIPIPDPTLVYFNNAQLIFSNIKNSKKAIKTKLELSKLGDIPELASKEVYNFIGSASIFVTSLYMSLESFTNQLIPNSYEYRKPTKTKIEIYTKEHIQISFDLKRKIKEVINPITGKDYLKENPGDIIWELRDIRDMVVHTKQENDILKYSLLIKELLGFNYEKGLIEVSKLMNYYKKDYVVECDCGEDF